ncbi:MAG: sarcosine oxidase subunit alpha family protein [Proteobacteria bacterium]|nr:sarcosine oxidase subunit alpha family protein [Pseudomonadota bacterium]
MSRARRLGQGGYVDRSRPIRFTLDGRSYAGFAGDTLASALLACGVRIIGRSFKYHRPRGFLCAGAEEPNGLFTLGSGARTTPNTPGTMTELTEGLIAACQNGWPSVRFDLMSVLSLAAPIIGAGFYYKTFMGPRRRSWMFYEPFIRRAAGLGRAVHQRDPDRYETRHHHADVLVIGAGPAGISAARAAARTGARVLLCEQDFLVGGSLLGEGAGALEALRTEELAGLATLEVMTRTTAAGLYDSNTVVLVERRDHARPDPARGDAREILKIVQARAIVFATGAIERPLVFAGNDLPGVMLAGAVRCYLHRYAVLLGERIVVATTDDAAWQAATELAAAGAHVTLLDERAEVGGELLRRAAASAATVVLGAQVRAARGRRGVRGVRFVSPQYPSGHELPCDLLCMSGGWSPVLHLTSHTGIKPAYRADLDAFVPGGYAAGHFGAGALTGAASAAAALETGSAAGLRAAQHAGYGREASVPAAAPGVAVAPAAPARPRDAHWGKAFVDFQNDVTTRDVATAYTEGYESVEHLKRYTTLGMGTEQGKTSNVNALRQMAQLRGIDVPAAGTTTFRPPYTPVSIGALAGRNLGQHFRPVRRSPLHDWHLANGATMIEAGPWLRAWYYAWAGADAETAYVEEMRLVRSGVGLSDVSSLGKIDVQGPDAGEFLNRLYVNEFARLPVGKARYGVMLNDDATVLDDGTTARFGETRYFMTTTTAQAAEVMSRLEFLLQTAWTDLRVQVASVTDQWAGMAIAGPRARAALALALPGIDVSDAALPFMGCQEVDFAGVPLRILRLSFSGELAFELYVPSDCGTALWQHLLASAQGLGIRPYGLEALASLRIEKGHVAGLELDHRNTLDDLGLGKMARTSKPFVGRELRGRPELQAPERWSLVGLECQEPAARLRGGAILFAPADPIQGHGRGYITSVTWSTQLNRFIALGLYQGGLAHAGEEVLCAYPLRGELVRAKIVSPVFIDPAGERLRA